MKKSIAAAAFLAVFSGAVAAEAATESYSSVHTSVSGGSSASAVVQSVISGSNSHSEIWINGQLIERSDSQSTPVSVSRPSAREIIGRERAQGVVPVSNEVRVEQRIQSMNGSTTGEVHVYRKENGQVVEDRVVPIPANTSGKPYVFRTKGATSTRSDSVAEQIIASNSGAVIVRDIASSAGMPWLLQLPFFSPRGLGVAASTTVEHRQLLTYDESRTPLQSLFDRIFKMFR